MNNQARANKPSFDGEHMPFGMYKDMLIEDLPTSYLRWIYANSPDDTDLYLAIEAELNKRGE